MKCLQLVQEFFGGCSILFLYISDKIISLRFLSVKYLRELRGERGLSMKQLAQELKVTDGAISNWENDVNEPKISYLIKLAKFFGVSADYLLGLEE